MARITGSRVLTILAALLCFPSPSFGVSNQTTASNACSYLQNVLGTGVVLPTEASYSSASKGNWVQTAWASPTCVIQATTAQQVSQAVRYLSRGGVHFAIRSGGHSPAPLGANINDGVLFDMSGFNSVQYNARLGVAVVGTGMRWGDVYRHLDQYNVTVVGGRILGVGVGGLTLGSGLSYLSDLYGLACDNVVLADGSIVNANKHSHPDLWWALKGGANNFGIVTRFTLITYPTGLVWGGYRVYTLDAIPALFDALLAYQSVAVKDPYANLMMQAFPLNGTLGVLLNMVYNKPVGNPAAFTPFYDIPAIADTVHIQPMTDFLASQVPPSLPRLNWYATSFKTDATLFETVEEIVTTSPELDTIRNLTAGSIAVGWQPISTSAIMAGHARGGNALGLANTNQTWFVIDIGWWDAEDDAVANEAAASLVARVEDAARTRDQYVDYIFMNDAAVTQDVIGHYGMGNVAKLRAVQRRYDPLEVFQKLVPGGNNVSELSQNVRYIPTTVLDPCSCNLVAWAVQRTCILASLFRRIVLAACS
ncbi:putative FAD-binding oxidoreductase [Xylaria bambusicola]|uniref:putative FAD-binding oxidoreductase n=1 Tax=Xylaria bambusicola TaxID=326684 RepID=UPI0020086F64|nr:putative FAD-binding oxidoreductase [Xylaria bambusicola]KAI0517438.1 putative FAD-binding oxidoreductase [Xylaria bambusicola]